MIQLNDREKELVALICKDCRSPGDVSAVLKTLFVGAIEKMLEAEMSEHLGYEKHNSEGDNSGNSCNGYGTKTIKSGWAESQIDVPRDRNGSFSPKAIRKRQTRTDGIEAIALAMYAKGMSTCTLETTCDTFAASMPHQV